ncbi:MAG: hypothetical protein HC880_15275 [Bacteroidia bacterium]|nr:hypothetical protein [Bacteroidia bacterium]
MQYRPYIFVLGLICLIQMPIQAQKLEAEEMEALRAELKEMKKNPAQWKNWKQKDSFVSEEISMKQRYLDSLKDEFDRLADQADTQTARAEQSRQEYYTWLRKTRNFRENVVFRVQIGYYNQHPIDRFRNQSSFLTIERNFRGIQQYMLGNFRSYEEARHFSQYLNRFGVGSYVVGYKNSLRVEKLGSLIDN